MATVTRQFKLDFETWAQKRIDTGEWTLTEIEGLRGMIRKDLTPGPDQLRQGLTYLDSVGVERPAMIDDHEERAMLWTQFFADEVIRAAGINQRIRTRNEEEKRKAA